MFREMDSFIPCSQYFKRASKCKLSLADQRKLKLLVEDWGSGAYDEDPDSVVYILTAILERNEKKEKPLYTESDMRKAHEFGTKYVKGTVAQAQQFKIEKLLK